MKPIPKNVILRIRLPKDTAAKLDHLCQGIDMSPADMARIVMSAVSRVRSDNFHKAIAALVEAGE